MSNVDGCLEVFLGNMTQHICGRVNIKFKVSIRLLTFDAKKYFVTQRDFESLLWGDFKRKYNIRANSYNR